MKERKFIKLPPEKAPQMFSLVLERMKWMDEKGIEQWNVMSYDKVYSLSYYEQKCSEGRTFALEDEDGAILCAAVLLEHDSRWSDDAPRSMSITSSQRSARAMRARNFSAAQGSMH